MKRSIKPFLLTVALWTALGAVGRAQEKLDYVPLRVQLVISRYQGEKKVSSMPYTVSLNSSPDPGRPGQANLRMGAKIPVIATTFSPIKVDGKEVKDLPTGGTPVSYSYHDVGTNIDCFATTMEGGRYRIAVTIDDTSVYGDDPAKKGEPQTPSFRSFKASDSMILRDGQTTQFTAAIDKVTGESTRVDVTLTVVK